MKSKELTVKPRVRLTKIVRTNQHETTQRETTRKVRQRTENCREFSEKRLITLTSLGLRRPSAWLNSLTSTDNKPSRNIQQTSKEKSTQIKVIPSQNLKRDTISSPKYVHLGLKMGKKKAQNKERNDSDASEAEERPPPEKPKPLKNTRKSRRTTDSEETNKPGKSNGTEVRKVPGSPLHKSVDPGGDDNPGKAAKDLAPEDRDPVETKRKTKKRKFNPVTKVSTESEAEEPPVRQTRVKQVPGSPFYELVVPVSVKPDVDDSPDTAAKDLAPEEKDPTVINEMRSMR